MYYPQGRLYYDQRRDALTTTVVAKVYFNRVDWLRRKGAMQMPDVYMLIESTWDGTTSRAESGLDEKTAWKWYEWSEATVVQLYKNGELIAERRRI